MLADRVGEFNREIKFSMVNDFVHLTQISTITEQLSIFFYLILY